MAGSHLRLLRRAATLPLPHSGTFHYSAACADSFDTAQSNRQRSHCSPRYQNSSDEQPSGMAQSQEFKAAAQALMQPTALLQAASIFPTGLLSQVESLIASSGAFGPPLFTALYALGTVFFFPAAPLSLAVGYLFGPLVGIPVVAIASTLGCALAFALSRSVARPLLEPHLRRYPKFCRIDRAVAAKAPAKTVFLLRLSPLLPLTLLSYLLGVTSIGFWPYVAASGLGLLPISAFYVLLGGAGKGMVANSSSGPSSSVNIVMMAVGLLTVLAASKLVANIAAEALDAQDVQGAAG